MFFQRVFKFFQIMPCYMNMNHPIYSTSIECRTIVCQAICWALGTPIRNKFTVLKALKAHEEDSHVNRMKNKFLSAVDLQRNYTYLTGLKGLASINVSWRG